MSINQMINLNKSLTQSLTLKLGEHLFSAIFIFSAQLHRIIPTPKTFSAVLFYDTGAFLSDMHESSVYLLSSLSSTILLQTNNSPTTEEMRPLLLLLRTREPITPRRAIIITKGFGTLCELQNQPGVAQTSAPLLKTPKKAQRSSHTAAFCVSCVKNSPRVNEGCVLRWAITLPAGEMSSNEEWLSLILADVSA